MDKKKLIGTIIGVICFIALIAGATFAWMSATVTVTNNVIGLTGTEMANTNARITSDFFVNYNGGTAITGIKILNYTGNDIYSQMTSAATGKITVTASRATTTADGDLKISLKTTSNNALTNGNILRYAVCNGTCVISSATTPVSNPTNTSTGLLATGLINNTDKELVTINGISTSTVTYNIYLWIDQLVFYTNDATYNGLTYAGYVYATATQD